MKTINLDKFKKKQVVILNGVEYEIYGVTVGMFLDDIDFNKLREEGDENIREKINMLVDIITRISNIPIDVLRQQPFEVMQALMIVAQGGDPTEEEGLIESKNGLSAE